jgi:hypothetical protein
MLARGKIAVSIVRHSGLIICKSRLIFFKDYGRVRVSELTGSNFAGPLLYSASEELDGLKR